MDYFQRTDNWADTGLECGILKQSENKEMNKTLTKNDRTDSKTR